MLTLEQLLEQTSVNTEEFLKPKPKEDKKDQETPENWKPKNALTNARVVSTQFNGKNVPYIETHVHYVKNKSKKTIGVFLCPKRMFGKECPMCDFGWSEYNENKKLGIKSDEFKRFLPSKEYVALIIDRETEENEFSTIGHPVLKCFKFPNKVREQIDLLMVDPDYKDITNLSKGTDLKINFNKEAADAGNLSLTVRASATAGTPIFNRKFADAEKDFDVFRDVYTKMIENKCNPLGRFNQLDSNGIFDLLKKMKEETSDKEEVEAHPVEDVNLSEEAKMAALQKELNMA